MPRYDDDDLLLGSSDAPAPAPSSNALHLLKDARAAPACLAGINASSFPSVLRGQVLELCGPPGQGKTRVCLSYAIEARLKAVTSIDAQREVNQDREVLIVDTEGAFTSDIIHEAAQHAVTSADVLEALLNGIHLIRASERDHLPSLLHSLTTTLTAHPHISLLIIDSLSPPLRTHLLPILLPSPNSSSNPPPSKRPRTSNQKEREPPYTPAAMRTHLLQFTRRSLSSLLAPPHNLAIIATVQMASRRSTGLNASSSHPALDEANEGGSGKMKEGRKSTLAPALGSTWHPPQTWRVTLHSDDAGRRLAHWTIVPPAHQRTLRDRQAAYRVTTGGIEDDHSHT